ncbi:hypothetical protein [Dyadobacter luteus]|nr:hypothetical protein [Dyadobacter luteus]
MRTYNPFLKRLAKVCKFAVGGIAMILLSAAFLYPQIFNCEIIRFSGFNQLRPDVFASPGLSTSSFKNVLRDVRKAEARIDSFYKGKVSRPAVIICTTPDEYKKYCSSTEGAGCSLGTPWGSSFIVLNLREMNVDVISHEMSHIELLARVGWWKTTMDVPQWYNEGVALMLDQRFVSNQDSIGRYLDYLDEWSYYTRGGQEILELENIKSVKDFFAGDQRHVMLAYMTSGLEVSYWLYYAGPESIDLLVRGLRAGGEFDDVYWLVEQSRKGKVRVQKLPSNPLRRPHQTPSRRTD